MTIRKIDVKKKQLKQSTRGVVKKVRPRGGFETHPSIKCKIQKPRVKGIRREVKLVILSVILVGIGIAIIKILDWYGIELESHIEQKLETPQWAIDAMK